MCLDMEILQLLTRLNIVNITFPKELIAFLSSILFSALLEPRRPCSLTQILEKFLEILTFSILYWINNYSNAHD